MKFTLGEMMVMVTLLAIAMAPIARLGIEFGVYALLLIISTIAVVLRFVDGLDGNPRGLPLTVAMACLIAPLDMLFILYTLCR